MKQKRTPLAAPPTRAAASVNPGVVGTSNARQLEAMKLQLEAVESAPVEASYLTEFEKSTPAGPPLDTSLAQIGDPVSRQRPDLPGIFEAATKTRDLITGAESEPSTSGIPVPETAFTDFGSSVTLGFANDKELTVGGTYRDRFRDVRDAEGSLAGSYLDTARGLTGQVVTGPVGANVTVGGGYSSNAQVLASLQSDGTALDAPALQSRADLVTDTEAEGAGAGDEVRGAIESLRSWGMGDRVESERAGSLNLGLARPGLVGAGVSFSTEGVESRTVERMEGDTVRLTLGERDSSSFSVAGTAGFGIASAGGGVEGVDVRSQAFDFDLSTPEGERDYALAQYAGAFPGAAQALDLNTLDDAIAFIEGGGFEGLDEDSAFGSAAELNAALLTRAVDPESTFGTDNGWVSVEQSELDAQTLGLSVGGIDVASARWEQENGRGLTFENGVPTTRYDGRSGYSQAGLILEDGQEGSRVQAFNDGRFDAVFYDSFESGMRDAEGPLADAYGVDAGVRAAVTDPTYVRTVSGNLGDFGSAYADLDLERDPGSGIAPDVLFRGWLALGDASTERANAAMSEGEMEPSEYIEELGKTFLALESGDIDVSELRPDQALIYADQALAQRGDARFEGIALLAGHQDPAVAAEAMALLVGSGDENIIDDFANWLQKNPELAATLSIDSAVIAGNTNLNAAVGALDANRGSVAASNASEALSDLVAANMSPEVLEETLAGFDVSAAGGGEGGLNRFYRALPTADRAAFITMAGQTKGGTAFLADLAANRPDLLIDPSIPEAERAQWVEKNLGGVFDGVDTEAFLGAADASRDTALLSGDASAYGPKAAAVYQTFAQGNDGDNINQLRAVAEARGEDPEAFARRLIEMEPAYRSMLMLQMQENMPAGYTGAYSTLLDGFFKEAEDKGIPADSRYALDRTESTIGEAWDWGQFYGTVD